MRKARDKTRSLHILRVAAELMDDTGKREVDIKELASRVAVSRPTIHAMFGRGEEQSTKTTIYRRIHESFLQSAREAIEVVLHSLPPDATPIDRLLALFRATLMAFRNNEAFGKVVLHQLNLRNDDENENVFLIFQQVDRIIADARRLGQLDAETVKDLKDFEIRHILFTVTRGLLRAYYLRECFPIGDDGKAKRKETGLAL